MPQTDGNCSLNSSYLSSDNESYSSEMYDISDKSLSADSTIEYSVFEDDGYIPVSVNVSFNNAKVTQIESLSELH